MGFLETYDRRRAGLQVHIHRSLRFFVGPMPAPIACQDAERPHVVAAGVWPCDLSAVHVIDWASCLLRNLLHHRGCDGLTDRVARLHRVDARGTRLPARGSTTLALLHGPHCRGCWSPQKCTPGVRPHPSARKMAQGPKWLRTSLELRGASLELLGASLELLGASLELRGASLELRGGPQLNY